MEKRGSGETSLVKCFVRGIYKVITISSELMARVRDESNRVVFKGIVKELAI